MSNRVSLVVELDEKIYVDLVYCKYKLNKGAVDEDQMLTDSNVASMFLADIVARTAKKYERSTGR